MQSIACAVRDFVWRAGAAFRAPGRQAPRASGRWLGGAVLGLLSLSGCGLELPDVGQVAEPFWLDAGARGDASGDAPTDAGQPALDASGGGGSIAAGGGPTSHYYVFWDQSRVLAHNLSPFGDPWQPSRTTTIGLLRVDWLGSQGQAWMVPCAVHSNEVASSQLSYPAAFIHALAEGPFAVQAEGADIVQPGKTQWLGLMTGYTGDLPDPGDATHPAVVDADGDGQPGATIYVNMPIFGDQMIFVAERLHSAWRAAPQADGSLLALPLTDGAKVTLGATASVLVAPDDHQALDGEPPEELRLWPTTAETGCMALLAAPETYGGISWPP